MGFGSVNFDDHWEHVSVDTALYAAHFATNGDVGE